MTAMVGYGREGSTILSHLVVVSDSFFTSVFNYRSQYWLWSPLIGSACGGITASILYDVLIYTGSESFVNTP
jgi:aquaglyceroporin related protein, other eukaryote